MVQSWPRPLGSLSFDEKLEVQRLLKKKGYYDGKIDGYLGKGTLAAVRSFQEKSGLKVDGEPNQNLLKNLQQ